MKLISCTCFSCFIPIKCDRNLPCSNCQSRNKTSLCRYETPKQAAPSGEQPGCSIFEPTLTPQGPGNSNTEYGSNGSMHSQLADLGYVQNGSSTIGLLANIESNPAGGIHMLDSPDRAATPGIRERYKCLIRQLPPRPYVEQLVDIYFREFDWNLDIDIFKSQLCEWYSTPFHILSEAGPLGLPPDLRAFPALLFQALAGALIVLPKDKEGEFEPLKYAGNMSFVDLGLEYSESGAAILALLGKPHMTELTVLAGFVRSGVLKYTGAVTESVS